ncbi:MAG TPA: MFS transporter [Nocardioides sp.]|nr:MFS transporter [Nocardioides sp.]
MGHDPLTAPAWTPWRTVLAFGYVSLSADMVYEAMRGASGPLLGSLGASALTVGIVTGAGEGIALILRLVTGPWADAGGRHWRLTVVGYGLTAVCVPLLAVTPALGAAGIAVAATLILLERTGKAIRSPSKSALLARVAKESGRGRAFGVHKAMDQVGAFAGPLAVSGMAALTGVLWPGLALMAIPGAVCLVLLAQLRRKVPSITGPDPEELAAPAPSPTSVRRFGTAALGLDLPVEFHRFSLAAALATAGLMTFGVISYRFVEHGVFPAAAAPLVYAGAMAVAAVAALGAGELFDRWGGRTLLLVPALVAGMPLLAFADSAWLVLGGVALWGAATGILDSTVKAQVASLVPGPRRASGYGVFSAVQGLGAVAGGAAAGALADHHTGWLAIGVAALQLVAFVLLERTTSRRGRSRELSRAR